MLKISNFPTKGKEKRLYFQLQFHNVYNSVFYTILRDSFFY